GEFASTLPELDGTVDLVISNPPYIPVGATVPPEVAEYDPAGALWGGTDGLDAIRAIEATARRLLRPGGLVAVGPGAPQGAADAAAAGAARCTAAAGGARGPARPPRARGRRPGAPAPRPRPPRAPPGRRPRPAPRPARRPAASPRRPPARWPGRRRACRGG